MNQEKIGKFIVECRKENEEQYVPEFYKRNL